MTEREAWVVWVNSDLTEGRGAQYPKHICESQVTAKRYAQGADVQGTCGAVRPCKIFMSPSGWIGPIRLVQPSDADKEEQKRLDAQDEKQRKKKAALERARSLGMSQEEIEALRS